MHHGVIVIGAGVAGCAAALEAARLGKGVLLLDDASAPGLGSFASGTIPAAVLRAAGAARRAGERVDLGALVEKQQRVLAGHLAQLAHDLARAGVRFERARATLRSPTEVSVDGSGVRTAQAVVIAAGTRPRRPDSFPFDDHVVCDEESILRLERLPRSLVIVGAEVVGCEFACLFAALGVSVTLIERRRRLLRCVDREILEALHARMQQLGIVVALEEEIEALEVEQRGAEPHATLRLSSGRVEKCDRLLVLAGRQPDAAALAPAGVQTDTHGFVMVDESFQTSLPGVYAVGDVVGHPFRIGSGVHQARTALLHAAGRPSESFSDPPIAIYTLPEISLVGMIEEAVRRLDVAYGVGFGRLETTFRGRVEDRAAGFVKLVFRRDERRLLGVQILGEGATDLVHLAVAWLQSGATLEQIADSVFNHPSLAEAYRVAALDALARD